MLNILLEQFPVIDESTPWEQIIEFRSTEESRRELLSIRKWATEVGRTASTIAEIGELIEHSLAEYKRRLALHRIKYSTGKLETVVVAIGDAIDNLLRVRWGTAARSLFALRRQHIDMIEGEASLPGAELAYIVRGQQAFGSGGAQLWCKADAARLRPGSRAAYFIASVTASRRLQFASRGVATPRRQPPRRSGLGTRDRPHSLHQGHSMKAIVKGGS